MNRRTMLKLLAAVAAGMFFPSPNKIHAGKFSVEHPIKNPPEYTDKKRCDNCGMDRNMWARTRHEFRSVKGKFHTCSIHCLVVLTMKLQIKAEKIMVAEYFHPENMIDGDNAVYVIGSAAPGTMTGNSKIAFAGRIEAETFAEEFGGRVAYISDALSEAKADLKHQGMKAH